MSCLEVIGLVIVDTYVHIDSSISEPLPVESDFVVHNKKCQKLPVEWCTLVSSKGSSGYLPRISQQPIHHLVSEASTDLKKDLITELFR